VSQYESKTPSDEQIRERAYELYCQRGAQHGNDVEDWVEAERQLYTEATASYKSPAVRKPLARAAAASVPDGT